MRLGGHAVAESRAFRAPLVKKCISKGTPINIILSNAYQKTTDLDSLIIDLKASQQSASICIQLQMQDTGVSCDKELLS